MSAPQAAASAFQRARSPDARYDTIVIGGGINGAGVFRDLCLQGVKCLLVDSDDFCAGASAAPSRLIHGGIKYLETGEFRLVAQSTLERNLLLRNAPHYVKPIETVLPIRSYMGGGVTSAIRFFGGNAKLIDRGLLISKVGLEIFDFFGRRRRVMPRHRVSLRGATRRMFPDIADNIVATATYYDARVTHAERLGLELVLDGLAANPSSLAINHCAVAGVTGPGVKLVDRLDGASYVVAADVIINAAGAWIDRVNAALEVKSAYIGGAKGSHLILDNPALLKALAGKMVYFGASDGRVGLLYPFFGQVLVGSTDLPIDDPDLAVCEDSERDYMLAVVREVFPRIPISADQVRYVYCGVRPLPKSDASDPGAVSRDHSIGLNCLGEQGPPILSLIGGKWTTFRGFAAEASDRVLSLLGRPRLRSTENEPIGGGRDYPRDSQSRARLRTALSQLGIEEPNAEILIDRYGGHSLKIAGAMTAHPDSPLSSVPHYTRNEIAYLFKCEIVGRLADVLFRRTEIALSGSLTRDVACEVATIGAATRGWNPERTEQELANVADIAWRRNRIADFDPQGQTTLKEQAWEERP